MKTNLRPIHIRNLIFGVEDSLVSTVGLLSGIAVAGVSQHTLVLTGFVLIFVEAFSMGIGSFLSESTAAEADHQSLKGPEEGGLIMFVSYIIAGLIPLLPYLVMYSPITMWISISASMLALLALGLAAGRLLNISVWRNAWRTFLLGGLAIVVGMVIGQLVPLH
jgi:vacuolar iron transporter family protein